MDTSNGRNALLDEIQKRVLWLACHMVDYANNERPNPTGLKVGGHQASSASVVTVMTYLFFEYMRAGDRISVKPHASPVYHAIQYLLGNLDPEYLKALRGFHGLQAYPSRTKDPDGVDFSTGSVGLGAVAPNFAWLAEEYVRDHVDPSSGPNRRFISLVGDAELDEGVVWESIADPSLADLQNVLWVVDLNRQSLDRIVPGIRVKVWREMFQANGWKVIDAKYGCKLRAAFAEPNGELLRKAIDDMSNDLYQRLLRVDGATLREWLPRASERPDDLAEMLGRWDDDELSDIFHNLGGHDFDVLREAFGQVDLAAGPNVLFAYTLKGWMLPTIGHPQNHSATLNARQMTQLRESLGVAPGEAASRLGSDTPAGRLCLDKGFEFQLTRKANGAPPPIEVPKEFGRSYNGRMSTQQIFGLALTELSRSSDLLHERVVTISPDVASSTNLGGWINKAGVWAKRPHEEYPDDRDRGVIQWDESSEGQHIELGISENNLFMALGQFGLTHEMTGEMLFPIGTLYDPFVRRGLDAFLYSVYSGGRFIVVGTPSGITLGPEGGSHQSGVTPSIGVELPDLGFYEPCFGQELEWILLSALENIRTRKESTYLRLTTKTADQGLFTIPKDPEARETMRRQVIAGAYRLVDRRKDAGYDPGANAVHVFASGAVVPEALEASRALLDEGIYANVINVTGPGPLYAKYQETVHAAVPRQAWTRTVPVGRHRRLRARSASRHGGGRASPHPGLAGRRPARPRVPPRRNPLRPVGQPRRPVPRVRDRLQQHNGRLLRVRWGCRSCRPSR